MTQSSTSIGVFPLPGVVLFPGATLPLHVFEPRYRSLVRDALAGDRRFALALLRPGHEVDEGGSLPFFPVGCAGRIDEVVPLPDGRFLLTLSGTSRVEFLELTREGSYRTHRVRYRPEIAPEEASTSASETLLRLVSAHQQIVSAASGRSLCPPLPTEQPFAATVNRIAFGLDVDPVVKYRLLENDDVLARAQELVRLLESALPDYLEMDKGLLN